MKIQADSWVWASVVCGGAGRGGARYRCYELWDQLARLSYRINICKHHDYNEKITDRNVFSFMAAWDILEFMQQVKQGIQH